MTDRVKIKEIFTSIQGEGPYIGYKQLFVRFCNCNLDCKYCDTDFNTQNSYVYSVQELINEVEKYKDCHSVSLTGGEPLLNTGFLKEFLPLCPLPVYLETNATLAGELGEIIDYVDYVAADIKLPSATGGNAYWQEHDDFFKKASHKKLFAKVVFDKNITDTEISQASKLAAKYSIELIIQPAVIGDTLAIDKNFVQKTLDKFLAKYKKVRLIPQIHKFMNIR